LGDCNGVLHLKSSPSVNLAIEKNNCSSGLRQKCRLKNYQVEIDSWGWYAETSDLNRILTLEDNVKLPTTALGDGYVQQIMSC